MIQITDELLSQHAAEARDLWLRSFPDGADIPERQFPRRFERRMTRRLGEQRRSPRTNQALRTFRRAAAILLAAGALSFSGLMTGEAYREKMVEVIAHVFHDLTEYRFVLEESEQRHGMEEAGEGPLTELPEMTFAYIPDGMEKVEDTARDRSRYILYEAEDGSFFELEQFLITENSDFQMILDTEDSAMEELYIDDSLAVSSTKNGTTFIVWTKKNVLYQLYGTIAPAELRLVAENIIDLTV